MSPVIIFLTVFFGAVFSETVRELDGDRAVPWVSGVAREMGRAAGHVLSSLPEARRRASGHVHVCFHGGPDISFLRAMVSGGEEGGVALTVWTTPAWGSLLERTTYHTRATHVLVGPAMWLQDWLGLVQKKTAINNIGKQMTQWLFISTQNKNRDFQEALLHHLPEQLHFLLLQRVSRPSSLPLSRSTTKYMHWQRKGQRGTSLTSDEVTIELLMAVYRSDGSASFRKRGYWSTAQELVLNGPLQAPSAPYFGGRVLTLTTLHKPGVFEPHSSGRMDAAGGYIAEILRDLQHHLHFTSLVTTTNAWGTKRNDTWNGMVGFLTRREADLAPLDFSPSWTRLPVVDFSEVFSTDGIIIISQAPRPLMLPFLLLQVFSIGVWASVVAVGLLAGNALWGLECIYNYYTKSESKQLSATSSHHYPSYWETLAVVFKLFLVQSSSERQWSRLWSGRILSSFFFLVALSVVALYQGSIIAFLAVPRNTQPIDSAADLMERLDSVVPIVRKNTVYYNFIVNFESYRPIANNFKFYLDSFLNTWNFFRHVEAGEYALIDTYSSGVGRAANFEAQGKKCRFYASRKLMKTDLDLMIHPQNSVYRHHIDQALRQLRSFGLIDKIKSDYFSSPCSQETGQRDPLSLSLTQMQSAFYVLAAGSTLSFLCFIVELAAACVGCAPHGM